MAVHAQRASEEEGVRHAVKGEDVVLGHDHRCLLGSRGVFDVDFHIAAAIGGLPEGQDLAVQGAVIRRRNSLPRRPRELEPVCRGHGRVDRIWSEGEMRFRIDRLNRLYRVDLPVAATQGLRIAIRV